MHLSLVGRLQKVQYSYGNDRDAKVFVSITDEVDIDTQIPLGQKINLEKAFIMNEKQNKLYGCV